MAISKKRSKNKVGSDIDGVLVPVLRFSHKFRDLKGDVRKKYLESKHKHYANAKPLMDLKKGTILITGRRETYRAATEAWVKKYFPNKGIKVYMLPNNIRKTRDSVTLHKANTINELGITQYQEDDEKVFIKLLNLCPHTEINCVEPVEKEINLAV